MFFNIVKILVFVVFLIEIFACYTLEQLIYGAENNKTKAEVGLTLISGYILRGYMAYALLKGMFL